MGLCYQSIDSSPILREILCAWKGPPDKNINTNREQNYLKGTMLRQAHSRVDEKHFKIVGPTFSNTVGEFRKLFHLRKVS